MIGACESFFNETARIGSVQLRSRGELTALRTLFPDPDLPQVTQNKDRRLELQTFRIEVERSATFT